MAKKKTKKKSSRTLAEYHKSRNLKKVSFKDTLKKAGKYAKNNPYEIAATALMLHPGIRLGAGIAKVGKSIYKGVKKVGAGTKKVGGKKISGAPLRKALGTKVKGQGKTYKTRAQAEVAAGGTKKMKGATIDKVKGGYQVNPSRGNVAKSWKTAAVVAGGTAEVVRRSNKNQTTSKKKKKTTKKKTTTKRKTYKSVESKQGKKVVSQRNRNTGRNQFSSKTSRRGIQLGAPGTQSGTHRTKRTVRKKKATGKKLHGSEVFRRRLGGQRGY